MHRDIFSTVEAGEKPEGWSGGEWSVAIGETAIDNWGAELTSWNHFLKYDSGSRFLYMIKNTRILIIQLICRLRKRGKAVPLCSDIRMKIITTIISLRQGITFLK